MGEARLEDTWWSRDLPVLDAAVELFEDEDFVEVRDLAEATGFEPLTPSMRTQRTTGQTAQVTASAQVSGLRRLTITASEAA